MTHPLIEEAEQWLEGKYDPTARTLQYTEACSLVLRLTAALRAAEEEPQDAELDALEEIEGRTPWEFACNWYHPEEIARVIKGRRPMIGDVDIPLDVRSPEFAEWLTDQYRRAMTKGIEIALRSLRREGDGELKTVAEQAPIQSMHGKYNFGPGTPPLSRLDREGAK